MNTYILFLKTLHQKNPQYLDLWVQILFAFETSKRVKIPPIKKMDRFKKYRCVAYGIKVWKEIIKTPIELKKGYLLTYDFSNLQVITPPEEKPAETQSKLKPVREKKPRKPKPISLNAEIYESIISYLNDKSGRDYRATTKSYHKLIDTLLNNQYTIDDIYLVIDKKCEEWIGTDYEKFLRPETLFGSKFDTYKNQQIKSKQQNLYESVRKATKLGWNNNTADS